MNREDNRGRGPTTKRRGDGTTAGVQEGSRPVIRQAEFLTSVFDPSQLPEEGPVEIAFAGRSNVGKSSLMNSLLGRHNLVKVSSRPGFTQGLNFFLVNRSIYFVDMPGYGFAKAPKKVIRKWQRLTEHYLENRQSLAAVVCLLDIRRRPDRLDLGLLEYLNAIGKRAVVVLNKADKVSQPKIKARLNDILPLLPPSAGRPLIISARTGKGIEGLLAAIMELAHERGAGERG